jgi:hypothetical protein
LHHDPFEWPRLRGAFDAAAQRCCRAGRGPHEAPRTTAHVALLGLHGRHGRRDIFRIARRVFRIPAALFAQKSHDVGNVRVAELVAERRHSRSAVPDLVRDRRVVRGLTGNLAAGFIETLELRRGLLELVVTLPALEIVEFTPALGAAAGHSLVAIILQGAQRLVIAG